MEEWWKALEDECNLELRTLFQFQNPKMKKLLQKLQLCCRSATKLPVLAF